jgi:nitroreductase
MDVQEAIRTVLAVRAYRDEPVPDDVIHDILDAGRLTASAGNRQPWTFVVIQDREVLETLGSLIPTGSFVARAAFAVAVVADKIPLGVSDASRAVQNMVLAAWAHGVGSTWVGFSGMLDQIKPVLAIPADLDVVAVLPFGYPADDIPGKRIMNRKPLEEIVRWGTWNNTSEP